MKQTTILVVLFCSASAALAELDCGEDSCLTPMTLQCRKVSDNSCTDLCYFKNPTNPMYCTDTMYSLVANTAVRGRSIACNEGSSRLEYSKIEMCSDMCDSCVGCVGFVDNRDASSPYCVFKNSESTLYSKSSKDYYRGGYSMLPNTAINGDSLSCDGSSKHYTKTVGECDARCNSCDGCVGYVYNREAKEPYCVFKGAETNIYQRKDKDYYRQDTSMIKRFPMDSLALAIRSQYDTLLAENPDEKEVRFEDVVELSFQLLRGESFIEFPEEIENESLDAAVFRIAASSSAKALSTHDEECIEAIVKVAIDAFAACFAVMGLASREANMAARALVSGLDATAITGFEALIIDISNAESNWEKAKSTFALVSAIKTATGTSQVLKALKHSIRWYDYIIMEVTIAAQFVAITASDGAAMIAEFVLLGAAITQEVIDAVAANRICSNK